MVTVRRRLAIFLAAVASLSIAVVMTGTPSAVASTTETGSRLGGQTRTAPSSLDRYAPKARPPAVGQSEVGKTTTRDAAQASAGSISFIYAGAAQYGYSDGSWTWMTVNHTYLDWSDYHTLSEIAVESADGQQIVEVGWMVDRGLFGDANPHLFVYHWVNGQRTCYNGCGYIPTDYSVLPGATLADGMQEFGIQHVPGGWYIGTYSKWIGYFPDYLWGGGFTQAGLVQWFGEVSANSPWPCTDMGNSLFPWNPSAATVYLGYFNGPGINFYTHADSPNMYSAQQFDYNAFRYGGPGSC